MAKQNKNFINKNNKIIAKIDEIEMEAIPFEFFIKESKIDENDFFKTNNGETTFFGEFLKLINSENLSMFSHITVKTSGDIAGALDYTYEYLPKIANINNQIIYRYKDDYYRVIGYNPTNYTITLEKVLIVIDRW